MLFIAKSNVLVCVVFVTFLFWRIVFAVLKPDQPNAKCESKKLPSPRGKGMRVLRKKQPQIQRAQQRPKYIWMKTLPRQKSESHFDFLI